MVFRYPAIPRDLSPQVKEEVKARRLQSFSALNRNDVLDWKGPSLYPNSLAPRQSTNPDRRTPIDILLSKRSPSRSEQDHHWCLTVLEALWVTHDSDSPQSSQVWRCKVSKGDSGGDLATETTVVLKLYYPGLYRQQGPQGQRWTNEHGLAENEAIAYERFESIQGIDVPLCYGFFNFNPLVGPRLIGVILEDLVSITTNLHTYTVRARKLQTDPDEHMKFIDRMLSESIRTLDRLNMCNTALHGSVTGPTILVLQPPSPTSTVSLLAPPTKMVFVGFDLSYTAEESMAMLHQPGSDEIEIDEWLESESSNMINGLCETFGHEEVREWLDTEDERPPVFA